MHQTVRPAQAYVAANPWTLWLSIVLSFATILVLGLSQTARRTHPYNLLAFFVFVLCEAFLVGTITAAVDTSVLLLAFGATAGITLLLGAYALQTRRDLTLWSGGLIAALWALLFAMVVALFFPATRGVEIAIGTVGALVFRCATYAHACRSPARSTAVT